MLHLVSMEYKEFYITDYLESLAKRSIRNDKTNRTE